MACSLDSSISPVKHVVYKSTQLSATKTMVTFQYSTRQKGAWPFPFLCSPSGQSHRHLSMFHFGKQTEPPKSPLFRTLNPLRSSALYMFSNKYFLLKRAHAWQTDITTDVVWEAFSPISVFCLYSEKKLSQKLNVRMKVGGERKSVCSFPSQRVPSYVDCPRVWGRGCFSERLLFVTSDPVLE